jgi:hypothetical protein
MSECLALARRYASAGLPVFPLLPIRPDGLCQCGKADCAGKHPASKGWTRSIGSLSAVEAQWRPELGERGIGLACGPRARVWVLDIDPRHHGHVSIRELEETYGRLPRTLTSCTGGGGWHLFFKWPEEGGIGAEKAIAPGVDVRGEGAFVVLPPSHHVSGRRYAWLHELPLVEAPDWLLQLVRAKRRRRAPTGVAEQMALVPDGRRHDAMVAFCGTLRAMGLREATIVECGRAFLRHEVERTDGHSIDWEHAERSMRDVARRYPPYPNRGKR